LFITASHSWPVAYFSMAALMAIGVITTLLIVEPENNNRRKHTALPYSHEPLPVRLLHWLRTAVIMPFVDFFQRNGTMGLLILTFIALFRLTDITMGVMANPFYLDVGFTLEEIASIAKVFGVLMTMLGALLGGLLVARFGVLHTLVLGGVLVILSNLLFALMANNVPNLWWLGTVISADNLSAGVAGSAFIAYLSGLTNVAYTATQYALFSSLMTLPGKFVGGFSGQVVESIGYPGFFLYTSALGLPALLLAIFFLRRRPHLDAHYPCHGFCSSVSRCWILFSPSTIPPRKTRKCVPYPCLATAAAMPPTAQRYWPRSGMRQNCWPALRMTVRVPG
jgi:PAT family beta-lactamase induction signal transducer AmpG